MYAVNVAAKKCSANECDANVHPLIRVVDGAHEAREAIVGRRRGAQLNLELASGAHEETEKVGEVVALDDVDGLPRAVGQHVHPQGGRVVAREVDIGWQFYVAISDVHGFVGLAAAIGAEAGNVIWIEERRAGDRVCEDGVERPVVKQIVGVCGSRCRRRRGRIRGCRCG